MRRLLSAVLSLAIAGLSAGLEPYSAWAQVRVEAAPVRAGLPGLGVGAAPLGQSPSLASPLPASVSLNGVLPVNPSVKVAPVAQPAGAQAAAAAAAAPIAVPGPAPAVAQAAPVPSFPARAEAAAAAAAPSAPLSAPEKAPAAAFKQAAERVAGTPAGKDAAGRQGPLSAESQASGASVQFDGAARRAGDAPAVPGAAPFGRVRSQLLRSRTPAEAVEFTGLFIGAIQHRSKFKGKERWDDESWQRLGRDVQRFLTGQSSSAVLTKRGPAVEAGVFKFKWGDQDLRVFARYDAAAGRLTLLDLRTKEQLLRGGEDAYYDRLARDVQSGHVRVLERAAAEPYLAKLGGMRLGAAVEPVFRMPRNGAADEGEAAAPAAGPAAAPLLEGRVDPASLRLPWDLRVKRAVALGAHYALLTAVPVFLGAGFGLAPLAVGALVVSARVVLRRVFRPAANGAVPLNEFELTRTRELLLRLRRGETLTDAERASLDERAAPIEQLLTWAEGTVEYLTGRAGLDPQRAPRVWIEESSHDLHWAASVGGRLDKSGAIYLGAGFVLNPLSRAVGVLAHEMGHLFFGDAGWLRERLRMRGGYSGGFDTGMRAAGLGTVAAMLTYGLLHAALFAADPTLLVTGALWAVGSMAAAAGGLLAGLAATRQEELRADHFSGWLTDPAWLAEYLSAQASHGAAPRSTFQRWYDHLFSTHPAWETRVERLARMKPGKASAEAVLPSSDSLWGLSGELQATVQGADQNLAVELQGRLGGAYDLRLYQGAGDGVYVLRAHPAQGARLGAAPDQNFLDALAGVLKDRYPGATLLKTSAAAHPGVMALQESALGRSLLKELSEAPIAVRWETSWTAEGPRAALSLSGPKPEILLNPTVYWKASPKAVAAALAHELFHYRVWRKLQAAGITWLDSGGLEFERLAQGVGYRVFAELGGQAMDDVSTADGRGLFAGGLQRWARAEPASEVELLRERGYANVVSLKSLLSEDAAGIAANIGKGETAESVTAKLAAAAALERAERRGETFWKLTHPFLTLGAMFPAPKS